MSTGIQHSVDRVYRYARTGVYTLGIEDRPVHAAGWRVDQLAGELSAIAFSLLPVRVRFAGNDPVVLTPSVATVTVPRGSYRREPLVKRGQRTIFLMIPRRTWERPGFEHALEGAPPLRGVHAPSSPRAFALARQLARYVHDPAHDPEPLVFEECCARIIDLSLDEAENSIGDRRGRAGNPGARRLQRELINATLARLHQDADRCWSLNELADDVELSPAYLSRLFRAHTGMTITRALTIERIARALERLPEQRGNLARVALECGFGSHARMSEIFSSLLGTTPSSVAEGGHKAIAEARAQIGTARAG